MTMRRFLIIFALFLMVVGCKGPMKYGSTVSPTTGGSGGAAGAPTDSTKLQQPVMFVGTGAFSVISTATTTGTIASPVGVLNGDLELVFIGLNNATSTTFVPPAGWAAVASCNSAGNTTQIDVFSHTAASEGGTIAAFTWTTNASGNAWASAYRNATVDVCAASTAASATTYTTAGITAAATTDRVIQVGGQPAGNNVYVTTPPAGSVTSVTLTTFSAGESSYPITSTAVAGLQFTSGGAAVWAGATIGLAFAAGSTAVGAGAITNAQSVGAINSVVLGSTTFNARAVQTAVSLLLPSGACIAGGQSTGIGYPRCMIQQNATGAMHLGDLVNNSGITLDTNLAGQAFNISTTTGSITSSTGNHQCTTCQIGTTGGGILSTTGGAIPTVTCSGGSTGTSVAAGSTNNRGQIVSSSSASTSCTITWSAAAAWPQAPFCVFVDGGASITPVTYSTGACGTSTCIVDFASTTSKTINYLCM